MRTGLDHLPEGKRRELALVVELIGEGFGAALARRTQERYRNGAILKIILFGSYARGGWVEDPIGRYFSDFDILVVVNHEDLTDPSEFWGATEERLLEAVSGGRHLRTPVSLIVHSQDDVDRQLRLGRYFFIDIARDGILIDGSLDPPFSTPEPLAPGAALAETKAYFDEWFESARRFQQNAEEDAQRGWNKEAAFLFHQAAERFYHCVLLVLSLYSPKTHSLNRLRALCEEMDEQLKAVWPASGKFERRCYELLRSAYVKARYSSQYAIEPDQLAWLSKRITLLRETVQRLCEERIANLYRLASDD